MFLRRVLWSACPALAAGARTVPAAGVRGLSSSRREAAEQHRFFDFTPDELQAWLDTNGFEAQKEALRDYSGSLFLQLSKDDLKELLGTSAGLRLYHARNLQHASLMETDEAALIRDKAGFLIDMDGVLYHRNRLLPGVPHFISWLKQNNKRFLCFTNSSDKTPAQIQGKLRDMGIFVESERHIFTSALATANFLNSQKPHGSAFVIGEAGLVDALHDVGYTLTDVNPDYVVVGETKSLDVATIEKSIRLVQRGARLVGTNLDLYDKVGQYHVPSCGSLIQPIEVCTGTKAYFCGKPNPLMMRAALRKLRLASSDVCIIGDRMDTDVLCGLEAGLDTVLVMTGVTNQAMLSRFSYRPTYVMESIESIVEGVELREEEYEEP